MKITTTTVTADEGLAAAGIAIGPRGAAKSRGKEIVEHAYSRTLRPLRLIVRRKRTGEVSCRYGRIAAAMVSTYGDSPYPIVSFILAYGFDMRRSARSKS